MSVSCGVYSAAGCSAGAAVGSAAGAAVGSAAGAAVGSAAGAAVGSVLPVLVGDVPPQAARAMARATNAATRRTMNLVRSIQESFHTKLRESDCRTNATTHHWGGCHYRSVFQAVKHLERGSQ